MQWRANTKGLRVHCLQTLLKNCLSLSSFRAPVACATCRPVCPWSKDAVLRLLASVNAKVIIDYQAIDIPGNFRTIAWILKSLE